MLIFLIKKTFGVQHQIKHTRKDDFNSFSIFIICFTHIVWNCKTLSYAIILVKKEDVSLLIWRNIFVEMKREALRNAEIFSVQSSILLSADFRLVSIVTGYTEITVATERSISEIHSFPILIYSLWTYLSTRNFQGFTSLFRILSLQSAPFFFAQSSKIK